VRIKVDKVYRAVTLLRLILVRQRTDKASRTPDNSAEALGSDRTAAYPPYQFHHRFPDLFLYLYLDASTCHF
jgi:hypothetical protein